jgi:hypothetical protein
VATAIAIETVTATAAGTVRGAIARDATARGAIARGAIARGAIARGAIARAMPAATRDANEPGATARGGKPMRRGATLPATTRHLDKKHREAKGRVRRCPEAKGRGVIKRLVPTAQHAAMSHRAPATETRPVSSGPPASAPAAAGVGVAEADATAAKT